MVIRRDDVLGKTTPDRSAPVQNWGGQQEEGPTPQQAAAMNVLKSVDHGMTLTRFQIEAARGLTPGVAPYDVDNMVKVATLALSNIETTDPDDEKIVGLAIALEAIVTAVDGLDYSLEDVAWRVLNELR